jgi:hypothetical protein
VSVDIPQIALTLGTVTPPQGDVITARIHLGGTKEVSSFEVMLKNWVGKYSSGGSSPILTDALGSISIGRGVNLPQIISCIVEELDFESSSEEHYLTVKGRCWGERLFRRVVTKNYENVKGEAIVKDLMDNFAGLSHNRGGTETIEDTDTTYASLRYQDAPVNEILKYIGESADKSGAIGFDWRVAPDGIFEFFRLNSKTSPIASLAGIIEKAEYKKDIFRVRNKIYSYGKAAKQNPSDLDSWTESLTNWSCGADDTLSLDGTNKVMGSYSVYVQSEDTWPSPSLWARRALSSPICCGGHKGFQLLNVALRRSGSCPGGNWWVDQYIIRLLTSLTDYFEKLYTLTGDAEQQDTTWKYWTENLGPEYEVQKESEPVWTKVGAPDWNNINYIYFYLHGITGPSSTNGHIGLNIDKMFFDKGRFSAVAQAAGSLRELSETDEELYSDGDCNRRAQSLLAYYKDPSEYLRLQTDVLDYGATPLLPGDKIPVVLPNEYVSANYRVDTVEYYLDAREQTLETTIELGKVPPLLADYLYGLRSRGISPEKVARTKTSVW